MVRQIFAHSLKICNPPNVRMPVEMIMEIDYEAIKARLRRQQERDDARAIEEKKVAKTVRHAERMTTYAKWNLEATDKPKKKKKKLAKLKKPAKKFLDGKRICEKCGFPIKFKKLENGKWCPTNIDGSDHWDACKEQQSKTFTGNRVMVMSSGERTGRDYVPTKSDKLPWED